MTPIRFAVCGAVAVAAASGVPLSAAADESEERSEYDRVVVNPPPGIAIQEVAVENALGDVSIQGHDRGTIEIEAVKRAPGAETLERLTVSFTPDPRGAVSIGTALRAGRETRPVPAGSISIDLVVHVPRAARPRVSVWKGEVAIRGLDNGAEVSVDQGDIEVVNVSGAIHTQSAHGRQEFAEVIDATIDAQSVEGDMELAVVRGDRLDAVVHRGEVNGRKVRFRELMVRTIRGDVHLEAELVAGGRYRIASYRGNVELVVFGSPARVVARSRAGQVAMGDGFDQRVPVGGTLIGLLGRDRRKQIAEVLVLSRQGNVNVAVAKW